MKKLFGIIILGLFLNITSYAHSQDYNCTYTFDGELFSLKLIKKNEYTYIFKQTIFETDEYILGENNEILMLGNPLYIEGKKNAFRVIFVDKVNKLFSITTLIEPNMREKYQIGVWGDATGVCYI